MSSVDFFFQSRLFRKKIRNTIRVSNSLDPDQARRFVGPDLGPNCLQRLSAGTARQRVKGIYYVIYGIISEFTDKGQFHYLTNLKGPQ